ncbi:MAG: phosphosulfolactate synthase [Jatrophihabitans sp.]|nr:MAG: phosphosulfolactate synthase [Jatrophihabitans sp.]
MHTSTLTLPARETKPRANGLTMMIDGGLPTAYFTDVVGSFAELIDVVKFGWGTSLVSPEVKYKIDAVTEAGIDFYFGGTLFEKFVSQDRFEDYLRLCERFGCRCIEVSNGTIALPNDRKAAYVARLAGEFRVFSEVGYKEPTRSETMRPQLWIDYIRQDLAAGAYRVITEARESGRSGICRPTGELRVGLIEEIAASGLDLGRVMFEAPNRDLQIHLIRRFGPDVSLGNIAPSDLASLETLRLGLRGDTFDAFDDLPELRDA